MSGRFCPRAIMSGNPICRVKVMPSANQPSPCPAHSQIWTYASPNSTRPQFNLSLESVIIIHVLIRRICIDNNQHILIGSAQSNLLHVTHKYNPDCYACGIVMWSFLIENDLMKQLSKYIQLITNIEALKFGKGLDRNFDKDRGRVGNRRNHISAMLADSRCIEGEIPGYCTTPIVQYWWGRSWYFTIY